MWAAARFAGRSEVGRPVATVDDRNGTGNPSPMSDPLRSEAGRNGLICGGLSAPARFWLSAAVPPNAKWDDRSRTALRPGVKAGLRGCAAPVPLPPGGVSFGFTASTPRQRLLDFGAGIRRGPTHPNPRSLLAIWPPNLWPIGSTYVPWFKPIVAKLGPTPTRCRA